MAQEFCGKRMPRKACAEEFTPRLLPMVRVALDTTPLLGVRTGVAVFVQHLITGLEGDPELQVTPFAVTWRGRDQLPRIQSNSHHPPMPARVLRAVWGRCDHPKLQRWIGEIDVVHATNYVSPPSGTAVELVSVHDLTFIRYPEMCSPDTRSYPNLIRRALARGAHLHADSQYVADEIVGFFGCSPERIHVIPLGVAPSLPSAKRNPPDLRERPYKRPYILSIGTIEPRKDFPSLLRAFALLGDAYRDLELVVVGQDGWGVEAYDQTLASLPPHIRDRVHRLGYVSDAQRQHLLADATLFAYPSRYEGFGLPPLEAMAAGVPVVATAVGSLPEVVGDAAVLVEANDPSALARAFESIIGDSQLTKQLIEAGRDRVTRYSIDRMCASFRDLYRTLGKAK
jgi:glycosyltransferase involved in cell wall biosynthesis